MSQLDRRQALRLLGGLGAMGSLTPLLSACSGADAKGNRSTPTGPAARIGLVVPQSGANRSVGDEIANGFQLFLSDRNAHFGTQSIELVTADEGDNPDSARAAVERLLKDDVVALAGISNPEALAAVKDTVEKAKVPLITPSPSPSGLHGAVYLWRTGFITEDQGAALGKWIVEHASRIAVLAEDTPSARNDVRVFIEAVHAAGGVLVGEPQFSEVNSIDFTRQFNYLRSRNVGAAYCLYTGSAGVAFVKQYQAAGLPATLQMYGPGLLTEGMQLTQQGDAAGGIFTVLNYSADLNTEVNRRFVTGFQKAYNATPSVYAAASYDCAAVLDRALLLVSEEVTPLTLNVAIGKVGEIDSPRGTWQFNQGRTPLQKWFLRQVRPDGQVLANTLIAELTMLG